MQNATELEGIIELDAQADAELVDLIAAYKVAKDAEKELEDLIDKSKLALNEAFVSRGVVGKGKFMLNGKTLLSRSTGVKKYFDRAMMFRLAPKAAAKAEQYTEYFFFTRPRG